MPPGVGVLLIMTYKGPLYLRQDERVRILLKYINRYENRHFDL